MWWGRKKADVGVQGQPVHVNQGPTSIARHEAVVTRVKAALAKEQSGKNRADRIASLESEHRRHSALLAAAREV